MSATVTTNTSRSIQLEKPNTGTKLGVTFGRGNDGSVQVASVTKGGIAASSSLKVGDTILSINGEEIKCGSSAKDVATLLRSSSGKVNIDVEEADEGDIGSLAPSSTKEIIRSEDPMPGTTRFCVTASVEIRKDPAYVSQ